MYDIFYISKHNISIQSWKTFQHRFPTAQKIENVVSFDNVKDKAFTKLFWVVWDDLTILEDFNFSYVVPKWDEQYIHVFKNGSHFDGICLFSKQHQVSEKEFKHRFFNEKKEIDLVVSKPNIYDKFIIDSYDDYLTAKNNSTTDMFWFIPKEVLVDDNLKFDLYFSHHNVIDRNMNHVFKNVFRGEETYTGISLVSKNKELSQKEITHRFLVEKKQHDIVASKLCPYDIVFISYNEPTADANFKNLKSKFPRVKRVHGVKGIHQAHIAAAKLAETCMFWVVDGDAEILKDFNFDHEVSTYEKDIVHVWRSKNPINDLVYGYGGVKLLPTTMTLNMDTSKPDMTTSISSKFRAVKSVSNITAFNTDPFSTWRSAFRECCKLSSKIIDRQKNEETMHRLDVWCTLGSNRPFGQEAIAGAKAGKEYGSANKDNLEALKKINDFDWLKRKFNE
jgi:hypothetical protein